MEQSQKEHSSISTVVLIVVGGFILVAIILMLKNRPSEYGSAEIAEYPPISEALVAEVEAKVKSDAKAAPAAETETAVPSTKNVLTLAEIAMTARTWEPAFVSLFGKKATDFTMTDITGKSHTLSDYRGKNVMLVMWGTWCGPCKQEIPHLIALQKIMGPEKLAIMGISVEEPAVVKAFVEANPRMNYTIIAVDASKLPAPYNQITGFPSAFFVDPEGRIKFATLGVTTLGTMKAIVLAPPL